MSHYTFQTDLFGVNEDGFHLLRSGYNYKSYTFESINKITIKKGRLVRNWMLLLSFGIFFSAVGLYSAGKVFYEYYFANNFHRFYIEQIIFPVLPTVVGIFSIYQSLRIGPVIEISSEQGSKSFPLKLSESDSKISDLILYLQNNNLTNPKFQFDSTINS